MRRPSLVVHPFRSVTRARQHPVPRAALSLDRFGEPLHTFPALRQAMQYPADSRGDVRLRSADPARRRPSVRTSRRRIAASPPIRCASCGASWRNRRCAAFKPRNMPGPSVGDDDASHRQSRRRYRHHHFHPVGTAKMGRDSDPFAVVDESSRFWAGRSARYRRFGDATITSGNTNAPTMMIAEKGAR